MRSVPDAELEGSAAEPVESIAFDSRKIRHGSMFVALRGGYADGHDFLAQALANGATTALVEPETPQSQTAGYSAVARVPNTRGALARVAAEFYGHPSRDLKVIGVTGTDGKTSTCWYIEQMLSTLCVTAGLISTVSVHIPGQPERSSSRQTTPESLDVQRTLREIATAGGDVAILETTSHALETHRVDDCKFDVGVITNVTREHLDFHGSVENYRLAKAGLLRRVDASREFGGDGLVVLNADDEGVRTIAAHAGESRTLWYSATGASSAVISAENVSSTPSGSSFTIHLGDVNQQVHVPLAGSWNVANVLAASGALFALGIQPQDIADATSSLMPVPGRLSRVNAGQDFTVLVDYAHTPESIRSVLQDVRGLSTGRVLVAFGSAGERDVEKRALQGAIAADLADYAVFTSEDPRFEDPWAIIEAIAEGASQHGARRGVDFDCIEDRREAIQTLLSRAKPGDVVVLAGKGHEKSMIYGSENRPWDEAQVALDALRQIGFDHIEDEGTKD